MLEPVEITEEQKRRLEQLFLRETDIGSQFSEEESLIQFICQKIYDVMGSDEKCALKLGGIHQKYRPSAMNPKEFAREISEILCDPQGISHVETQSMGTEPDLNTDPAGWTEEEWNYQFYYKWQYKGVTYSLVSAIKQSEESADNTWMFSKRKAHTLNTSLGELCKVLVTLNERISKLEDS